MRKIFIGCLCLFLITSCSSEDLDSYEVGNDFIDNDVVVKVIDTFSVRTGTFRVDTLVTSGRGRILLGNIHDAYVGNTSSKSYFQLNSTFFNLDTDAVYDSVGMVLNYDGYYYGDTLVEQTYKMYRVLETIEPEDDEDYFYNTSTLDDVDTEVLGEVTFTPEMHLDSLYIPMNTDVGRDIFNKIAGKDITTSDEFIQYFKGVTIEPNTTIDSQVMGFDTSSSDMRLYYTIKEDGVTETVEYFQFTITDTNLQFNNIETDFSKGVIGDINDDETIVSSEGVTEDNIFATNSGGGLVTRIEMPSIAKLKEIAEDAAVLSAELIITPLKGTYGEENPLPKNLSVYIVNRKNELLGQLSTSENEAVLAVLNQDDNDFNENTFYTVDLTAFVETIVDSQIDLDYSVAIQSTEADKSVDRLVFTDTDKDHTKLIVQYLTY